MKKILSLLIVLAMLAATFAVFSIPAAAVDGLWDTHGSAEHESDDFEGDKKSIPGYEYTEDGLKVFSADWSTDTPWAHVSTNEKVDLKQGVYMQVRVDSFEYDAADRWLNFNIRNMPVIQPGSSDAKYGVGVQCLIKPDRADNMKLKQVNWYTGAFTSAGLSGATDARDADGKHIITIKVTWDGNSYGLTINDVGANAAVIKYMNDNYIEDSFQHIGFTYQSNKKGGEQAITILKFGTNEETAVTPSGDDDKENENYYNEPLPIADPSEIAEGEPAVLMNGDIMYSALKKTPGSALGAEISITEDMLVHVVATAELSDCGIWSVKNDVSYDVADFPVFMVMTKNYCSCGIDDCEGYEEVNLWLPTGEDLSPGNNNHISGVTAHTDVCKAEDDGYLFFIYDLSESLKTDENPEGNFGGRINATRVDLPVDTVNPGRNEFDVVMQCFFRTVEEAEAYAMEYLIEAGYDPNAKPEETTEPKGEETTEAKGEQTTEDKGEETTEAKGEQTTEAKGEETTEAKGEETTEAKGEQDPDDKGEQTDKAPAADDGSSSGGCFGTIGLGAIAIVAIAAAAGYVSFKKKD